MISQLCLVIHNIQPIVGNKTEVLPAQVGFRSSVCRASADYRRHIVSGLFKDMLETAW